MKISTKGRYALRLMIDLGTRNIDDWVALKDIASRQGVSIKYLEQIIGKLCKNDFVISSRGAFGGYKLSKNPSEYKVGDILRIIEGSVAPISCLDVRPNTCLRQHECSTIDFWEGLYKVVNEYIDSVTLQDLIEKNKVNKCTFCALNEEY